MKRRNEIYPFHILTAKTEKEDFRKGMEMGADDYITKPFNDIELLKAIEVRLKKSEQMRNTFSGPAEDMQTFLDAAQSTGGLQLNAELNEVHSMKKKNVLYAEGKRAYYVYYIVSGKIKTYMVNDDGKEFITGIHATGDFIGYTTVLEDKPYTENAEVLEDAELMFIPKEDFLKLIESDKLVAGQFIKLLTRNVLDMEEKLLSLAYSSLRKRIASALMEVYDKYRTTEKDIEKIEISRENLAHIVGTAKESLIRTLSDFKSEHLIDIQEGKIYIRDEQKLRDLPY
ncbi:MAG: cyclic nucleotide-binding domain-containing protein [Chitinophagales bacterium]